MQAQSRQDGDTENECETLHKGPYDLYLDRPGTPTKLKEKQTDSTRYYKSTDPKLSRRVTYSPLASPISF